jgi:hypothetical protein
LIRGHRILCFVGNAKNAGKTTVLNAVIRLNRHQPLAVTSIGLDGEELDHVTALPKPRILVDEGMFVATAADCLKASKALLELVRPTSVMTPLGAVGIYRVIEAGECLVGGPSTVSAMNTLVSELKGLQDGLILIDGAFSRKAMIQTAEACVFAVGAVRSRDIDEVVRDAETSIRQFRLPAIPDRWDALRKREKITLIDRNGQWETLPFDSTLPNPDAVFTALRETTEALYLPGSLGPQFAKEWIRRRKSHLPALVLQSPAHLVLPLSLAEPLFRLPSPIYVLRPLRLIGIAYNPVSPTGYAFDDAVFRTKLTAITDLPVFNVMQESEEPHE